MLTCYTKLNYSSHFVSHLQTSPDVQESLDIPKIDLINEMQEFLPFPLDDTPPIDRSVSKLMNCFKILLKCYVVVETSEEFGKL